MRRGFRVFAACLGLAVLCGCSQMGVTVSNPFSTVSDIKDVYYGQFTDIPVPVDMKASPANSLVTSVPGGSPVGLETFEGRVEASSLANAMIHNMARQGWSLRGSVTGKRTMQLHEKDQRYAVVYIYNQTLNTAMEIWVLNRLVSTGFNAGSASFSPAPLPSSSGQAVPPPATSAAEVWEGGVRK